MAKAQALDTDRFARLELLCDYPPDEAATYLDWLRARTNAEIIPHPATLPGPTDFDAIYRHARDLAQQITAQDGIDADRLTFHLSPGTPAMAALWIILAKTRFPAELIESELFGHEKGAFTGAAAALAGLGYEEFHYRLKEHFGHGFIIDDETAREDLDLSASLAEQPRWGSYPTPAR